MKIVRLVLVMILGLAFIGCANMKVAKEKSYAKEDSKLATVYFYRESMFQGWMAKYYIWENETAPVKLGGLKNGSYFYTQTAPGKKTFFINGEVRSAVTIDLKPGKTYYVQCNINMGFWAARPKLTEVTENEGLRQVKDSDLVMTELPPEVAAPVNKNSK
jgi:hypothetical protein